MSLAMSLAILEQTHQAVLTILHETLQKEAERHSTILPHQPFFDYFYENTPIMNLTIENYLDKITYYSQLRLKTRDNETPYLCIVLTTEAYFPPLYEIDNAWNLRNNYTFLWNNVNELMDNITYTTTWTISYDSPTFSFICESMDNLNDFVEQNRNEDQHELQKATQLIHQMLRPALHLLISKN
jgi:hypothetical protein